MSTVQSSPRTIALAFVVAAWVTLFWAVRSSLPPPDSSPVAAASHPQSHPPFRLKTYDAAKGKRNQGQRQQKNPPMGSCLSREPSSSTSSSGGGQRLGGDSHPPGAAASSSSANTEAERRARAAQAAEERRAADKRRGAGPNPGALAKKLEQEQRSGGTGGGAREDARARQQDAEIRRWD